MHMQEFVLITLIVFLAAFIQSLSGFGSALVAMPLLVLIMNIKTATPLVALYSFVIGIILFLQLKKHFDIKKPLPLIIGSVFGVPIGIYALKLINENIIKLILGGSLTAYSLYILIRKEVHFNMSKKWGYMFGFIAGCFGGAFNANGPPAIIYTTLQKWKKHEIKVTLQSYFLSAGIIIIAMHAISGITTLLVLKYFFIFLPALLLGIFLGHHFYEKIDKKVFNKIIYGILFILGSVLVITSL